MKFVFMVLAAPAVILVAYCVLDPIDVCLDRGGCWDYLDKVCRKDEVDAQTLCNRLRK